MPNPVIPRGIVPVIQGYTYGDPGGVKRTAVAGGSPRYALDYDRGAQQFQVSMVMKPDKFSIWTVFYHHLIKKGAISFEMELDSGQGCQPHVCNIVPGSYSAARTSLNIWTVGFTVEAESRVYDLTEDDAAGLVELWNEVGAPLDSLLARLARFALVDTTVLEF